MLLLSAVTLSSASILSLCNSKEQDCDNMPASNEGDISGQIAGGIRLTFLYDNTAAWPDVPGASFVDVPEFLKGTMIDIPLQTFPRGSAVRYSCPAAGRTCEAYVFLYACHPCESEKGALPALLTSRGWTRSSCAPHFVTGVSGGHTHRMTSYRLELPSGTVETFRLLGDVEWVAFAATPGDAVDCAAKGSPAQCNDAALKDFCVWRGSCKVNKCVQAGPSQQGPGGPGGPGGPPGAGGCSLSTCVRTEWPIVA